ncbi:nucleotidyl cyclase domain-containing protein [Actinophytocola sediminis]
MAFRPGHTYDNVYLLVVDASGYSSVVRHNPLDRAAHAFDLLRERTVARVSELAAAHGCARADLWSWRGDGGMLAVHDESESVARDVALAAARDILRVDLPAVREELSHTELRGELRLRVAVHKGTIRYTEDGRTGAIHSPVINLAAHLEELTPPDCLAVSEAVYQVAGPHAEHFVFVGDHERSNVYLMTPSGTARDARRAWLAKAGLAGSTPVFAQPQRPSQLEKVRLVRAAHADVLDLGTGLRTSSGYLTTAERPAHYRDEVLAFLARGGTYRCVLLDPDCAATATLAEYRGEDLPAKIRNSIVAFGRFKERHGAVTDNLHVYQTRAFPGFAAIAVDLNSADAMILYSPYLMSMKIPGIHVEHGDSPHYLATTSSGRLLPDIAALIQAVVTPATLERVL